MMCTKEIVHIMTNLNQAIRPSRRQYSSAFKTQVVQECRQIGASVAGIGLAHGINANILHRWIREHARRVPAVQSQAFVPVAIAEAQPTTPARATETRPDIRIEITRGPGTVIVSWPLDAAPSCAAWLRDWLK